MKYYCRQPDESYTLQPKHVAVLCSKHTAVFRPLILLNKKTSFLSLSTINFQQNHGKHLHFRPIWASVTIFVTVEIWFLHSQLIHATNTSTSNYSLFWNRRPSEMLDQWAKESGRCFRSVQRKVCNTIFSSATNKIQRYAIYLFLWNALHVSGGSSAHHQELKSVYTVLSSWWCAEEPPETCRAFHRNK